MPRQPLTETCEHFAAVTGQGYFPVIVKRRNGELAVIMRGGAPHVGFGGRLDLITSCNSGRSWSRGRSL